MLGNEILEIIHGRIKELETKHMQDPTNLSTDKNPLPDKYHFYCSCGMMHKMSGYCVAQLASNHDIVHTCSCGNKTNLEPSLIK